MRQSSKRDITSVHCSAIQVESVCGIVILAGWGGTAAQALNTRTVSHSGEILPEESEESALWFAASAICWLPAMGGVALALPALGSGNMPTRESLTVTQIRLLLLAFVYVLAGLVLANEAAVFQSVVLSVSCGLHANTERVIATEPQKLPWVSAPLAELEKDYWDETFVRRNVDTDELRWPDK